MATSSFYLLNSEIFTSVWATLASPSSASQCWTGPPCCPSMRGSALHHRADPAVMAPHALLATTQVPRLSPGPSQTRKKPGFFSPGQSFFSFSFIKKKKKKVPTTPGRKKESWFYFVIEIELHLDTLRSIIIFFLLRGDGLNKSTIEYVSAGKNKADLFLMIWNAV